MGLGLDFLDAAEEEGLGLSMDASMAETEIFSFLGTAVDSLDLPGLEEETAEEEDRWSSVAAFLTMATVSA